MAVAERQRLVQMYHQELLTNGNRRYANPAIWDEEETRKRKLNQSRAQMVTQYYNDLLSVCNPAWVGVELIRLEKGHNGYIGIEYEGNTVVRTKPGGPAERSGITPGFKISLIEGVKVVDDSRDVTTKLNAAPKIFSMAVRTAFAKKVKKPKQKTKQNTVCWSRPAIPPTPSTSLTSATTMDSCPSTAVFASEEDLNSPPPLPELNSPPRYENTTGLDPAEVYNPQFHTVVHPHIPATIIERKASTASQLQVVCDSLRADLFNKKNEISDLRMEMSHMYGSSRHNNFLATENANLRNQLHKAKDKPSKPPPPPETPPVASPELHYQSNHSMLVADGVPEIENLWRNAEETTRKTQVEIWRDQHRSMHLPPRGTPATADESSPPRPFPYQ